MNDRTRIVIERREANDFFVRVDDSFADHLGIDEAIGVVASALFSAGRPLFVRTYAEWARVSWNRMTQDQFAGLLPAPHQRENLITQPNRPGQQQRFRSYLGGAVYLELLPETGQAVLTTENGLYSTNTIYLDADMLRRLNDETARLSAEVARYCNPITHPSNETR